MFKQFTDKDLLRKARSIALLKSVKSYPQGKFKYLDHTLIVGYEDYGNDVAVRVKLEHSWKNSKCKEIVYQDEYL